MHINLSFAFARHECSKIKTKKENAEAKRENNDVRSTHDAYHFFALLRIFLLFSRQREREAVQIELNNITDSDLFEMKDNIIIPRAQSRRGGAFVRD